MSDEVICEKCKAVNSRKNIHCTKCGHNLRDLLFSEDQTMYVGQPDHVTATLRHRRAYFARESVLQLHVMDANKLIPCDLSRNFVTLGRHPEDDNTVHIDLSEFDAKDKGVSRKHARLTRLNAIVMVDDLGALNGTFVNGERISPHKPCVLCNGDELCLGNFKLEVIFE